MKKVRVFISWLLVISMILCMMPAVIADGGTVEIHVSADGNDGNEGTIQFPVKTLERARDIYREYCTQNSDFKGEIVVHGGIYRLSKSFSLNSQDSGMKIRRYGDGEVLLRGSVKLPQSLFKKTDDEEFLSKVPDSAVGKIYEIDLSPYLTSLTAYPEYTPLQGGTAYYELFVGGKPQTIARWPNQGFALTGTSSRLTFESTSERLEKWKNSKYAMVTGYWMHNWAFENIYIGNIDVEKSTVTLSKNLQYSDGIKKGQRYYAMNMPEEMDIPGEYYIDCDSKKLYYYPSRDFLENTPELSILTSEMFSLNGASDVEISGITFEYARGNAIVCKNGSNIVIDGCIVRNIGNQAISVSTTDSVVKNCEIYNTGGAGISMSSGTNVTLESGNGLIINNNIYNFGRIFRTYQAGINISGVGNKALYNTIHDAPHSGLRFGGNDNIISHNEIYSVVFECSDSGGIYSGRNWTNWGNEISYNYLHDIRMDKSLTSFSVSAVYLDDMLSGITVKNNLIENCTQAALIGGGKGNIISENTITDCENGIVYDDRAVTGNWAHESVISGGTVYEGLLTLLANENFNVELWKEKYDGFSQMLDDVYAYQSDSTHETGYPENSKIIGNINYGKNTNNENYENISQYVGEYGEVSGNSYSVEKGDIIIPENGADNFLWSNDLEIYFPGNEEIFEKGDIEFVWSRAGGADRYETVITNENGETVFQNTTLQNGFSTIIEKKGTYNWKVTAFSKDKSITKEGTFEVRRDYYAPGSFFAGTDFEDKDLSGLKDEGWSFSVAQGDSIMVETDQTGNRYLKMVRNENNLQSGAATYAKLKFPSKSQGKITVTYDIMLENYRAGFRDMGSIQNESGGDVMRLLTHSSWVYGMGTDPSKYNFMLNNRPNDSYLTVKRVINLDDNTYSMHIYQDGKIVGNASKYACNDGTAENLLFRLQYQSPFEPKDGEGDAVYRIDNVSVDMGEIAPSYTFPEDDSYDVSVDSDINIKWNSAVNPETVNTETVEIYENETKISKECYTVTADEKNITISFLQDMKYNTEYNVVLSKNIASSSLTHTQMSEDFKFSFKTQKQTNAADSDYLGVYKTVPENNTVSENVKKIDIIFNHNINPTTVNSSTVKVYKYSYPIPETDYSLEASDNMVTVTLNTPIEDGGECKIRVAAEILPENQDIFPMSEDYILTVKTEKNIFEKKLIEYDFEDWTDFSAVGPCITDYNGWIFELYDGDSVTVETDSVTGNKGLKIQKGSSESKMKVYMDYEVSGEELVKVNFDTRFENQTRRIHDWGSIVNTNGKSFLKMVVYGSGYWHKQIGDTKRYLCGLNKEVTTVEQLLNVQNSEYAVNIYRNGTKLTEKSETADSKTIPSRLYFAVSNIRDDYAGSGDGDGIYWIDNVSVKEIYTPKVESITTDYISSAEIAFNRNIDSETLTKANVRVYDNDVLTDYTLDNINEKNVKITFSDRMKAGHVYKFEIDGICSENNLEMLKGYTEEITCIEKFEISDIYTQAGNTYIKISTNIDNYICIAAVKDNNNRLIKSKRLNESAENVFVCDWGEANVEYYFWEGLDSLKPLTNKKIY